MRLRSWIVWTRDNWIGFSHGFVSKDRTTYHLLRDHDNGLDGEAPVAVIEKVFETGAEEIDDEDVVKAFLAKIVDIRNSSCSVGSANQSTTAKMTTEHTKTHG